MISHSSEIPTPVDVLSQSTAMVPRSQWNNCTLQAQWCMQQPTAAYRTYNTETYTNSRHQSCKNTNNGPRQEYTKKNMVNGCHPLNVNNCHCLHYKHVCIPITRVRCSLPWVYWAQISWNSSTAVEWFSQQQAHINNHFRSSVEMIDSCSTNGVNATYYI